MGKTNCPLHGDRTQLVVNSCMPVKKKLLLTPTLFAASSTTTSMLYVSLASPSEHLTVSPWCEKIICSDCFRQAIPGDWREEKRAAKGKKDVHIRRARDRVWCLVSPMTKTLAGIAIDGAEPLKTSRGKDNYIVTMYIWTRNVSPVSDHTVNAQRLWA